MDKKILIALVLDKEKDAITVKNMLDDVADNARSGEDVLHYFDNEAADNIVLPPSLNTLRGDDCKADETLVSFAISKKSSLRVMKGLTGCCVNAVCWYLCMEKNNKAEILEIIANHSKLKIHLY